MTAGGETVSETKPAAKTTKKAAAPKIVWDDNDMRTTYANVVNAASTREEVTIFFGANQSWHAGSPEYRVKLTDRIVMNPYAAKRLSILLGNVVAEYEKRHGVLDLRGREQAPTS